MEQRPANSATETIIADLRVILRALLVGLGLWRLKPGMALAVYQRTSVAFGRIERLLVRFRAGRLWRIAARHDGLAQRRRAAHAGGLPRRFGWLVRAGGHDAACVGLQLQAVLAAPEMTELLAVSPQAGRILRPLCRALALELPATSPRACEHTRPRIRQPRVTLEPFRIPLPRSVLTAARRQGFGKRS